MSLSPYHILSVFAFGIAAVAVTTIILVGAILLFRFDRSWPTALLLVGAVALFIITLEEFAFGFAFEHGWVQGTFLLQGCVVSPALSTPLRVVELISYCLPIGLLWYGARVVRNGLTRRCSQPPAAVDKG
jgi:hypothetical protein